jgi:HSP20 family protein
MTNSLASNRLRDFSPGNWSDQLEQAVNQFFGSSGGRGIQAYYVPACVWEDANSYHVELDLPGVKRENVDLTFEKGTLRISSERSAPEELNSAFVDERRYGKVTRTVTLPESIDPDSISGKLNDGVLRVTVAKRPEAQPKRITIS